MAVVYGLGALAIGVATGVSAQPDVCGSRPIENLDGTKFLRSPPVGFVMDQHMVHKQYVTGDGEKKKNVFLEREAFALSCTVDEAGLQLVAFNMCSTVDSPSSSKFDRIELCTC
jgi:hypothetical protein